MVRTDLTPELSLYECARTVWCITEHGYLNYLPNLPANIAFLAIFSFFFLAQLLLGIYYRTYSYMIAVLLGISLECIGYGGRIGMYYNVFRERNFVLYLCGLTIGPAFFSAAIYLCIGRIINVYGSTLSFLKPRTMTVCFICCDLVSLVLQAVGGGLASAARTEHKRRNGVNVMIAGLSTQVAATAAFCVVCAHLMWSVKKHPEEVNTETVAFRRRPGFRLFLGAIGVATITILIRCIFRVAELSKGFKSRLANDEVMFMIWDTTMMIICVMSLTIAHPGHALGDQWRAGRLQWGSAKDGRAQQQAQQMKTGDGGSDAETGAAAAAAAAAAADNAISSRPESVSAPGSEDGLVVGTSPEKEVNSVVKVKTTEQ